MKPTTKCDIAVSRDFLNRIENENAQLSFGIDNLAFMIEVIEDSPCSMPQKESLCGAMWCAFNQINNSYTAMTQFIEAEYARLRGEYHD